MVVVRLGAGDGDVHVAVDLGLADGDGCLRAVVVEAERHAHDAVPVGVGALTEPEQRGFFQRERPEGRDGEGCLGGFVVAQRWPFRRRSPHPSARRRRTEQTGRMLNAAGKYVLGVLLVPAMVGCATSSSREAHPQASVASKPAANALADSAAVPAFEPCVQLSSDDLLTLEQGSDAIVEATIDTAPRAASNGAWLTTLSNVKMLSQKSTSPLPAVRTLIDNSDPGTYRHSGTYILFLSNDPGSAYYVITNGLDGTFKIDGSSITRECPNFLGTAPTVATEAAAGASAITTVAGLKALLPPVLPAYTPPAKPTAVPLAS